MSKKQKKAKIFIPIDDYTHSNMVDELVNGLNETFCISKKGLLGKKTQPDVDVFCRTTYDTMSRCIAKMFGAFFNLIEIKTVVEIEGRQIVFTGDGPFVVDVHVSLKGVTIEVKRYIEEETSGSLF